MEICSLIRGIRLLEYPLIREFIVYILSLLKRSLHKRGSKSRISLRIQWECSEKRFVVQGWYVYKKYQEPFKCIWKSITYDKIA